MLIAKGNNLFYYTMKSETSNHLYEIDFLTSVKDKICPLEVKSGNYRTHKSLDAFCNKFSNRIGSKYVVHTKDYKWENGIIDEEIMSEEDEENVFDDDEDEFKKSLEVMYDLAFYLTEQRERLKMIRQRAEAGADVPVKVLRRQEYIVQGLEKLAKEEK